MTEKKTPAPGDEVYDIHGRAASYIARSVHGGHVVQVIYEHEDCEPSYGDPEIWREVFSKPPAEKLHGEIARLQNLLAAEQAALDAVRKMRADEDREYATRTAERKRFAQLKKLDDYIARKITHFVCERYYSSGVEIQTFEQAMTSNESRYDKKLRLLSLYGGSDGDLSWHVDSYSDGSGGGSGWYFPATSYEEAVTIAAQRLDERYRKMRGSDPDRERCYASGLAASARKLGLDVPEDVAAWASEIDEKTHQSNLATARKQFEDAKKRLQELEAS
jgi:hypothetical protein